MTDGLNKEDVARLMTDPSPENRSITARKLAAQFSAGALSEGESEIANEIFAIMVQDAEERVRLALAENLKEAHNLPHETALQLARDVSDKVALPMLKYSDVLTEEDLVEIVRSQGSARKVAVAARENVSEAISDAIVETGDRDAVVSLVSNPSARISANALNAVVEAHGDDERVHTPLVHRDKLPLRVAEKLVAKISDDLKTYLVANHDLSEETATDLILHSRERATVGLLGSAGEGELERLVEQLSISGRLTPSIILRALCVGDIAFFETAIAHLARVPVTNARILIYDEGELGFKSLFAKAGLPKQLYQAFRSAMDLNIDSESERRDEDPEALLRRMLERVLTDPEADYGSENVEYLLTRFNKIGQPYEVSA